MFTMSMPVYDESKASTAYTRVGKKPRAQPEGEAGGFKPWSRLLGFKVFRI